MYDSKMNFSFSNSVQFGGAEFNATSKTGPVQYFEISDHPKMILDAFEDRANFLRSLNILQPRPLWY